MWHFRAEHLVTSLFVCQIPAGLACCSRWANKNASNHVVLQGSNSCCYFIARLSLILQGEPGIWSDLFLISVGLCTKCVCEWQRGDCQLFLLYMWHYLCLWSIMLFHLKRNFPPLVCKEAVTGPPCSCGLFIKLIQLCKGQATGNNFSRGFFCHDSGTLPCKQLDYSFQWSFLACPQQRYWGAEKTAKKLEFKKKPRGSRYNRMHRTG